MTKKKGSDRRIEAYFREQRAQERKALEEKKKRELRAWAKAKQPPTPSKVEVKKVEPRPKKAEFLLKEEHQEKSRFGVVRAPERSTASKPAPPKPEFVPRHLRGAVQGEDGRLKTVRDPNGRTWL